MPLPKLISKNRRYYTRAEFARYCGLTPEGVYDAIKKGRLKTITRNGNVLVDMLTDGRKFIESSPAVQLKMLRKDDNGNGNNNGKSTMHNMSISKSKEVQERYKAMKMKLEYQERLGQLIEYEAVRRDWITIGTMIRKAVMAICDRISPLVAAETNENICYRIIEDECRTILEDLSNEIKHRQIDDVGDELVDSNQATGAADDIGMG
jgi:hypothetical protein